MGEDVHLRPGSLPAAMPPSSVEAVPAGFHLQEALHKRSLTPPAAMVSNLSTVGTKGTGSMSRSAQGPARGSGSAAAMRPPSEPGGSRSLQPQLVLLCGTWMDPNGTRYTLTLDMDGKSLSVQIARPEGGTSHRQGLIRLAQRPDGKGLGVVWGARPTYVLADPCPTGEEMPRNLAWVAAAGGFKKGFEWKRQDLDN